MYHAQDVALCSDTSIQKPLPLPCYAAREVCLIHCATIREMHFVMGSLHPALRTLKTFVYVLCYKKPCDTHGTNGLCAAHSVQNSKGQRVYIDMLHAWYSDEIALADDGAYEFAVLTQRFWQSHHAQVMLMSQERFENERNSIDTTKREIIDAFARLQSMPVHHTGSNCHALVQKIHEALPCSFTQRRQLYSALHAQEMHHGQIPEQVQKNVDEITHAALHNPKKSDRKIAFRALLHAITENK